MTSVEAEVGEGPRWVGGVTRGGVWSVLGGWSRTVKWRILTGHGGYLEGGTSRERSLADVFFGLIQVSFLSGGTCLWTAEVDILG